ncbi:putative Adenylate cyclase [Prochlorococcus marinus str. MIT 9321]|uniref:Putative Adenylate cyclase n=1 Tax=Prochlorococcus marinus str. MIT 9401 TaxID=167551 RepID=A0A0A2B329_PROMR|nr:putative Adenylate cyclase [Prochlorococcus marinus str. MIT 9322]KGG05032.1 putative Adenylate cyclase [Prochlorococcus marinus str. MIT 9321]KGG07195.1 putative Adenylate cyclase [Prochlorococcus marinus str. MIT 9401]
MNDLNNFNSYLDIDKINSQLKRAEIQKRILIRNIYREYELYLNHVRDVLYISAEKGLNHIYSYPKINDNFLYENEFYSLFEKKIRRLIYSNLPLLTVEQLKINEIKKNIKKQINFHSLDSFTKTKDNQKEKIQHEDDFQLEEPIQFKISKDISNASEYYQTDNDGKFISLDLDNNHHNNYLSKNIIFENLGVEKQFISSLIELTGEEKVEKQIYQEKENINQLDNLPKNQILNNFDLIDKSLENLLLNLSYSINQQLFKANLIKKMISKDSFDYLVGKNFMIKHPYPFVINFELELNRTSLTGNNFPSIIFFNISTVELEFKNLNLSIQRQKINELKNQFQGLIKKETYWRQKEITLNKIR